MSTRAYAEPVVEDPRMMFAATLSPVEAAILVDGSGLVLGGAYFIEDGRDLAPDISAALSGVSDEAVRATRHLRIGAWRSVVVEAEAALVALAPVAATGGEGALLVVAAAAGTPLGALRRTLARCGAIAGTCLSQWGG